MAEPSSAIASRPEDTAIRVRSVFERTVPGGGLVYDEAEAAKALFVIQAGQVELSRREGEGHRTVARLGPGEFFGELGLLLGRPRSHRAVAVGETRLLQLDVATFEAMCVEQPEIAIRVIQRLAARAIDLEQRLAALGVDDLLRPVVRVLLRHSERTSAGARFATTLRRLARDAGLSLLEAHRALGQLLDRRLVKLVDDVLIVPDLDALAASVDPLR